MRAILTALLCALALPVTAAVGDIVSLTVREGGDFADLVIDGMNTNGTWRFGWGTNNTPTTSTKLRLTVRGAGTDASGLTNQSTRTIYGTTQVRFPYPGQDYADQAVSVGGLLTNRIALSELVWVTDTDISATILAGLYSNSVESAAATLTVVNASTAIDPTSVWNWTRPAWERITNSTVRLGLIGAHYSARDGKPLASVRVITSGAVSGVRRTNAAVLTVDRDFNRLAPFYGEHGAHLDLQPCEFVADVDLTPFTAGEELRHDAEVRPLFGTNYFSTVDNRFSGATFLPASVTNLYDPAATYSIHKLLVDAVAGSDANGRATNVASAADINPAHAFLTIAGALNQGAASNNVFSGHNDIGGLVVYLKSNVTNWMGGTLTATAVPKARAVIAAFPGETVAITHTTGSRDAADRVEFRNIEFRGSANLFSGTEQLWFNTCVVSNSDANAFIQSCPVVWMTHCLIQKMPEGVRGFSAQNTAYMVRGCDLSGLNGTFAPKLAFGNCKPVTNGTMVVASDYSGAPGGADWVIHHGNFFCISASVGTAAHYGAAHNLTNGLLASQNVFECTSTNTAVAFGLGNAANTAQTNLMFFNNDPLGKRIAGVGYNDTGSSPSYKVAWSLRNNRADNSGFKADTFGTPNGARTGNWQVQFQVGCWGNVWAEINTTAGESAGNFGPDWNGMWSYHPPGTAESSTNAMSWFRFVARRSTQNNTVGDGGGDYRVLSDSPVAVWGAPVIWPFDIIGQARGGLDPVGAYSSASPRRGVVFR